MLISITNATFSRFLTCVLFDVFIIKVTIIIKRFTQTSHMPAPVVGIKIGFGSTAPWFNKTSH